MVKEHLSPIDTACLALCNHNLERFLKPAAQHLSTDSHLRMEFLTRLSRDVPEYYSCFMCARLHPWRKIESPSPTFKLFDCSISLPREKWHLRWPMFRGVYPYGDFHDIHFVHLQLAMRRYYYGAEFGIPVESLFYTEVATWPLGDNGRASTASKSTLISPELHYMTSLKSVEARVSISAPGPGLCLRTQELAVGRRENISKIFPRSASDLMYVCRHIGVLPSASSMLDLRTTGLRDLITSLIPQYSGNGSGKPIHWQRCQSCNTSWKLEIRDLGNDICLVSTRWVDLGPGLTPEDARWRIHHYGGSGIMLDDHDLVGDPRVRFEENFLQGSSALTEDELFQRNISFLKGQTYQTRMTRWGPSRWYLVGEKLEKDKDRSKSESSSCVAM
ncbi:hypothetical protein N7451_005207 [Penicillium sp. IBT 35674x]|nr:hypothetical protein N7451_005207 [Penicillium sp. IBT 35674x]